MKKSLTVTYEVAGALYVNITNACTNRCDFCIRNNADGAYGSASLWLTHEPSVNEIVASITDSVPERYREIVFCGYGEPTTRLSVMLDVARIIKNKYPDIKIRVNTNGQSDLIHGKNTAPMYEGLIDTVSVSLNAPTAENYDSICHSVYGKCAFAAVIEFAKNVKNYVDKVVFSVVGDFLTEEEISACRILAKEVGVDIRVRDYISKEE